MPPEQALGERDTVRLAEAIPLLETALQRGRRLRSGLPALFVWVPEILADTYERIGQLTKAETIYRDAMEQSRRQFGTGDPRTADALNQLGANLVKQKKYRDAEPLLRQSLSILTKKQPDAWAAFNARSVLGEVLLSQKMYAEAEPLFLQGYEGMRQRQDKIPPQFRKIRLSDAMQRLVRLYEATDQKAKAANWRKKLQEMEAGPEKTRSRD